MRHRRPAWYGPFNEWRDVRALPAEALGVPTDELPEVRWLSDFTWGELMVWRAAQQIIHMDRPCFLYRQFDANDELLYVGLTTDPHQRHLRHRQDSPWAHLIDRTEYEMHPNLWVGGAHESLAIETEGPLYNVVHSADRESARERRKQLEAAS